MPIPSEVPTSFVPHTPVPSAASHTARLDLLRMFLFSSIGIFITVLLVSGGIFLYQKSLEGQLAQRHAQLQGIEKTLNQSNIRSFVNLHDQLSSAQTILDKHFTLSRVFDLLETLTVKKLSFVDLTISIPKGKTAILKVEGVAANSNTLAAEAVALKKDNLLSHTTFSGFSLKNDGTVGFTFSAILNKALVQNFAAVVNINSAPATLATTTPALPLATTTSASTTSHATASTSLTPHTP